MIEPTDEMEQALVYGGSIRERLAHVLAIVQRDYRIEPRPPWDRDAPIREQCPYCMTGLADLCPWHGLSIDGSPLSGGEG